MKKLLTVMATALACVARADAALINLGDGTIKDTATNLIWLSDWSLAGREAWAAQVAWAQSLNFAGSNDWVLPTYNQYVAVQANAGGFSALQLIFATIPTSGSYFWTGEEDATVAGTAIYFRPDSGVGGEGRCFKPSCTFYAAAVRIDHAAVPEPATLALVAATLLGVAASRRRRAVGPAA